MQDIDVLCNTCTSVYKKNDLHEFLLGILSPQEIQELATRVKIIKLLKQGISQHQIAENLGVGVATVTRGSKELQKGRFKYV